MRPFVAALLAAVALLLVAAPAAARFGMPEPLTERGQIIEGIYFQIAVAGVLVFVLVFALLMWVLVRYREGTGKGRSTHEGHRGSLKAELVWTIIPLAIMLWIGVMSYAGLVKLDGSIGPYDNVVSNYVYDVEVGSDLTLDGDWVYRGAGWATEGAAATFNLHNTLNQTVSGMALGHPFTLAPLAQDSLTVHNLRPGAFSLEANGLTANLDVFFPVQVQGFQWFWQMNYGQGVNVAVIPSADAKTGKMTYSDTFHLPADTPILLNVTGGDVIHAFNVLDANRAYVSMDDANPSGPHKYHNQVITLPAGRYSIQCKEMCSNPGHGYMRAELIVEPKAAFDEWKADRALFGDAALREFVDVTASNTKLTYNDPAPSVVVAGTRVGIKLSNDGTQPLTLTLDGASPVEVLPGDVARVAFDAVGGKTHNVAFGSLGSFAVEAVTPDETITVDLADFKIVPPDITLEAGKGYLIRATNIGGTGHNLFIGTFGGDILAQSNNAGPGEVALVYFKPTTTGTLDWWCNVPGHHGLGMKGTVTVA